MKFNIRTGVSNHSNLITSLNEISRKDLVGKTKVQSPDRYNKRLGYKASSGSEVDVDSLISKDLLVARVPVKDYYCIIAYNGIMNQLFDVLKKQPRPNVTLQSVIKAISQAIDKTDVLVDCTCPDFKYRYAYYASKFGYKYGKPETRPPKKTNPDDNIGAMCKHLTSLLANKRWLIKLATIVNNYIKQYADDIRKKYNLSEDEFIINTYGRPSKKTNRNIRMFNKEPEETDNSNTDNSNNEEELELDTDSAEDSEVN